MWVGPGRAVCGKVGNPPRTRAAFEVQPGDGPSPGWELSLRAGLLAAGGMKRWATRFTRTHARTHPFRRVAASVGGWTALAGPRRAKGGELW